MKFLLVGLILLLFGCSPKPFIVKGYSPYCMIHYQTKIIDCKYDSIYECRMDYENYKAEICFPNRFTNKK